MRCKPATVLKWKPYFMRGAVGAVLVFLSGCSQLTSLYRWSEIDLNVDVATTDKPGVYSLSGQANLPDNTPITVAAVRYLRSSDPASAQLDAEPTYSILAYQSTKVQRGEWNTDLNLWQVASNGRFQEAWQLEQSKLGLSFQPDSQVIFLATLTPADDLSALEQELARRGIRFSGGTIVSTSEGFRYAQAQEIMAVALPNGATAPPAEKPEDRNGGWGDRYIIPQEPPNRVELEFPESRTTNAPPTKDEFLR